MFQHHPLDVNGRLLRRFYEPLVLLSVLDPSRGAQRPDLILDRGLGEQSKLWRDFLDQLAFTCDSEAGGDTVAAVAVEQSVENPIFWLASNSCSRNKARDHLSWILAQLSQICASGSSNSQVRDKITRRCINFSLSRVKAYTRWLKQAMEEAKRNVKKNMDPEDEIILTTIQKLETLQDSPHQLCSFAYSLRRHKVVEILYRRHVAHSNRGLWSNLRHYIGRLGSWTKAVHILVLGAETFPQRIENAQVKVISPNGPADLPNKDHLTDLHGVVHRMLSTDETDLAEELSQALTEADAVAGIRDGFTKGYSEIKPRPHAELLVLEHFHHQNLEFATNEKYIGCSKPSCYCCHIYMQCHPGGFVLRPCHGNLWINWAPPLPLPLVAKKSRQDKTRLQEHHTFKLLQEMLVHIRRDLREQIVSRRPKRNKLPDSTTGMSSVVMGMPGARDSSASQIFLSQSIHRSHASSISIQEAATGKTGISRQQRRRAKENTHRKRKGMFTPDHHSEDEDRVQGRGGGKPNPNHGNNEAEDQDEDEDEDEDIGVLVFAGRKRRRLPSK